MSTFLSQLPNWDVKRTLAHVFPGFLLYVGLLMGLDTFIFQQDSTLTSLFFKSTAADLETLVTIIGIGIFLGSILGVMIDGIGHWIFEDKWFKGIVNKRKMSDTITIKDAEDNLYSFWRDIFHFPAGDFPGYPDSLYPFTYKNDSGDDTVKLKDQLVSDYYSYFEFYLNSAISLFLVSLILPFYALIILGIIWQLSLLLFGVVLLGSLLLFFASIHTLEDYRKTRFHSIHGFLTKNQPEDGNETETKTTHTNTIETKKQNGMSETKETYSKTVETKASDN